MAFILLRQPQASALQKDLDICEVDQDIIDKFKKFRFRRKENPAAMICMDLKEYSGFILAFKDVCWGFSYS